MKNTNWNKGVKEGYNKSKPFQKKKPYEDKQEFRGASVDVRNDDVAGALRRLKKILERDDRQKDLAKNEYYEKPSAKRKRQHAAAKSRWARTVDQARNNGTWVDSQNGNNTEWMKTKKKRRAHEDLQKKIKGRGR
jgi:small subunit ribosomal protein S21|tara:strand:- start:108 stop:512 length:405 start_codon:yes stop_codon:yes gene_type:complete